MILLTSGEKFFINVMVKAFGRELEVITIRELIKSENNGEVPKGLLVDKTV